MIRRLLMTIPLIWIPHLWIPLSGGHAAEAIGLAKPVPDFSIPTTGGGLASLSSDPSATFHVICFLGTECPLARVYGPRLQRMSEEFAAEGVRFLGINSNVQDSMEELAEYVEAHGIQFPVAKDFDRRVALDFGATRTPEVFVVDRGGQIRYQGRIDDQYEPGLARKQATQHDLHRSLRQLLDGQTVTRPRTVAVGCLIALPRQQKRASGVTYCDQVIRVLQQHCIECHREGEIGPFVLNDYDEVVGWADMSMEVIDQGRMPPWHANPEHGSFANARFMPAADKEILRTWIDAGMPFGDASKLPPRKSYRSGWRLAQKPDAVFEMSPQSFDVPSEGTVEYQYFVVDPGFTEDTWVRQAQVMPGNRSVVHHCIVFTRPPDGSNFRDIGFLAAYVPGQVVEELPEGYAQRVKAGSQLVFQMHYTPTGKPESDRTKLGLVFADRADVTHEVYVVGGIEHEFEIPPGAENHEVAGSVGGFPRDGELLAITPHMHLRGKAFQFDAESGGVVTTLLDVPSYDFNWQHNYALREPLSLAGVDRLRFTAVFDNSDANPTNPDPSEYVTWGDQTWQEMAVTFVSVAKPLEKAATATPPGQGPDQSQASQQEKRKRSRARAFAIAYVKRFDDNGDGFVTAHELPHSVRMFSYWDLDHNGDGRISQEEIESEALARLR